jgi:hypothetical protein
METKLDRLEEVWNKSREMWAVADMPKTNPYWFNKLRKITE